MQYLIIILIVLLSPINSFAQDIQGMHISATGNNQYESEIKAQIDGRRRALILAANSLGIRNPSFEVIPYSDLKEVFSVKEKISEAASDEKYEADVTYSYELLAMNNLILKYGSQTTKDQYYKYIVIPVFKQKNKISFLDSKTDWLAAWIDHEDDCIKNKLLLIDPTTSARITPSNIFTFTYGDFISILPVKIFEKVLIATCEYFTKEDGSTYFTITTKELSANGQHTAESQYDVEVPHMSKKHFYGAIDRIMATYGHKNPEFEDVKRKDVAYESDRSMLQAAKAAKAGAILDGMLNKTSTHHLTKMSMKADIFSKEGLDSFKKKLGQMPEVVKFKIHIDETNHYVVEIFTDKTIRELSESFYEHGLSYREYDGEVVAFEVGTSGI